jgi:hypothetical protein
MRGRLLEARLSKRGGAVLGPARQLGPPQSSARFACVEGLNGGLGGFSPGVPVAAPALTMPPLLSVGERRRRVTGGRGRREFRASGGAAARPIALQ